jgi:hypothetical protein
MRLLKSRPAFPLGKWHGLELVFDGIVAGWDIGMIEEKAKIW